MRPDDVLSAIRDDIRRIATDSAWAFNDGWWPRGANPDRVVGVHTQDVFGRDESDMPESWRRDIGVGDGRSRQAYLDTAWPCTWIDRALVQALVALGDPSPPLFAVVSTATPLSVRLSALSLSESRVERIAEIWDDVEPVLVGVTWVTVREQHKLARRHLDDSRSDPPSARSAADQAVRVLSKALARGSTEGLATAEKYCGNCGMQPVGERTGDRCPTCSQYKWRSGVERPASRYLADNAEAFAAAARRRARGDGFGAA